MLKRAFLLAALLAAIPFSSANAQVRVGIGIGIPVYPAYRPYGYYRPYYGGVVVAPTVVVGAPAPVVYAAPPPPVVYAQPQVVAAPPPPPSSQQVYVQTSPGVFQPVPSSQIANSPPPAYVAPTPGPYPH
jgi:hypothetical protein